MLSCVQDTCTRLPTHVQVSCAMCQVSSISFLRVCRWRKQLAECVNHVSYVHVGRQSAADFWQKMSDMSMSATASAMLGILVD